MSSNLKRVFDTRRYETVIRPIRLTHRLFAKSWIKNLRCRVAIPKERNMGCFYVTS